MLKTKIKETERKETPRVHSRRQGEYCSVKPSFQARTRVRRWIPYLGLQTRELGSHCICRQVPSLLFSTCISHPRWPGPQPVWSPSPGTWADSPPLCLFPPLAQCFIFACFCFHFTENDTEVQRWSMACPGPPKRTAKPSALPEHTGEVPRDASVDRVGGREEQ